MERIVITVCFKPLPYYISFVMFTLETVLHHLKKEEKTMFYHFFYFLLSVKNEEMYCINGINENFFLFPEN